MPGICRPADEAGERPVGDRADGGDVTAQQDRRQRLDLGDERQQARYGPGGIEAVVPVQQDDRHGPPGGPDLLDEVRKPLPEPPGLEGQDHQRGVVDRGPALQRLAERGPVVVPDPRRVGEDERDTRGLLARQPFVVVKQRAGIGGGRAAVRCRIDQDPGCPRG